MRGVFEDNYGSRSGSVSRGQRRCQTVTESVGSGWTSTRSGSETDREQQRMSDTVTSGGV